MRGVRFAAARTVEERRSQLPEIDRAWRAQFPCVELRVSGTQPRIGAPSDVRSWNLSHLLMFNPPAEPFVLAPRGGLPCLCKSKPKRRWLRLRPSSGGQMMVGITQQFSSGIPKE